MLINQRRKPIVFGARASEKTADVTRQFYARHAVLQGLENGKL